MPIAHVSETGAINRLHFPAPVSGTCIMRVSGTAFVWYQIPAPIRTLFYSKLDSGVHVTEMMTYDCLPFNVFSCCNLITNYVLIAYVAFSRVYFRRQKNRRRKPAPENGVDLWRRFLEQVSWV